MSSGWAYSFFFCFLVAFIYIVLHNTDRNTTGKRQTEFVCFCFQFSFHHSRFVRVVLTNRFYLILCNNTRVHTIYARCTDKIGRKSFMMFWDMRLRLITQCDRGVFPHVCVVHCLFVVFSLSACVYRLLRFALLLRARHSTHICLPTIPQKQTNKKTKTKTTSYMGIHSLF